MPKLTSLNIVVQALQIFRERIVGQLLYLLLHLNQSDKPKSQHLLDVYKRQVQAVESGQADGMVAGMTITDDRKRCV